MRLNLVGMNSFLRFLVCTVSVLLLLVFRLSAQLPAPADRADTRVLTGAVPLKDSNTLAPPRYRLNGAYIESFIPSLAYTVSRPAHWNKKDWTKFSLAVAGTGAVLLADWEIKNAVHQHRSTLVHSVANLAEPFGNTYGTYLFPTMYAIGALTGQRRIESAGLVGSKSLIISTIVYTFSKKLIRRNRPDASASPWDYAPPFSKKGHTSSPSGHSNTIFTVATALALEFQEHRWVPPLVYSLASVTALSRI